MDLYKRSVMKVKGMIVVTKYYQDLLIREFKVHPEKLLYSPDGVDIDFFDVVVEKGEAREKLGLPTDKKIIIYTGSLLKWKGVETLVDSAEFLEDNNLIYIIGDLKRDDSYYLPPTDYSSHIKFVGLRPYGEIPLWLKAADLLVLTGTWKNEASKYYTSPLKLFEYMASRRPIVAPKLPSILDILNDKNSFLVDSDDSEKLADQIKFSLKDEGRAREVAERAYSDSKNYSWGRRAKNIIQFIKS